MADAGAEATGLLAVGAGADLAAGAGADVEAGADADSLATGADAVAADAGRAVFTGGDDEVGAVLPPPLPLLPGRNANMRSSVMAKPVCSSGASDKSGRLVMVI